MPSAIAIDFGTSRTKLAYLDEASGRPELMRLGRRDDPFIPSLFYLPRDSEQVCLGDDAEEMLAQDPAGIVEVLKRKLHETHVRANRRKVTPQTLLARLFADLRARAARELPSFGGAPADVLQLTVPAIYGPARERVLREATQQAGFTDVVLVPEPVAAARAWLAQASAEVPGIVVFDCGGGTVDWAYLRRDGADFHLVPECPPGGDQIGGYDLDRELLARVEDRLDDDALAALSGREIEYLKMLRIVKERYCRALPLLPLRIGSSQITLSAADIEEVFESRFIRHASEGLKGYLTQVRAVAGADQPPVLLVGGSARIKGLREALEQACDCETLWWERADYATVLGAVPGGVAESAPVVSRTPGLPTEAKSEPEPKVNQQPVAAEVLISGRYRDHGDGTVTDVKTGLQWMRCALGQNWRDGACVGQPVGYDWEDALKAADDFNQQGGYASHRDWRVPTIDELKTIIFCSSGEPKSWNNTGWVCKGDYSRPVMDQAAFPHSDGSLSSVTDYLSPLPFRSSSSLDTDFFTMGQEGLSVDFSDGKVIMTSNTNREYVRLVRTEAKPEPELNHQAAVAGGLISGRYRDHGDGTVTDVKTGLQWMRCAYGQTWRNGTCIGECNEVPGNYVLSEFVDEEELEDISDFAYHVEYDEFGQPTYIWEDEYMLDRVLQAIENELRGYAGYDDWRVPTIDELKTLVFCSTGKPKTWNDTGEPCEGYYSGPVIDQTAFPATGRESPDAENPLISKLSAHEQRKSFLSSSPGLGNGVLRVHFYSGYIDSHETGFVRLVRNRMPDLAKNEEKPENQQPVAADALISGRYRDHGDGTVMDVKTGLQWMRCALGPDWRDGTCIGKGFFYKWGDALQAAKALNEKGGYADYDDWRVPTIDELKTLVFCSSGKPKTWNDTGEPCEGDYSGPVIDQTAFPNKTRDWFWSSSPDASDSDRAWNVFFGPGCVDSYPKSNQLYVRLVRGGPTTTDRPIIQHTKAADRNVEPALSDEQIKAMLKTRNFFDKSWNPEGRFANDLYDNGDGTLIDDITGLMWEQGGSHKYMSFANAKGYIASLNEARFSDHCDWRLPTVEEAASLLEPQQRNEELHLNPKFDRTQRWIWTSSTRGGNGSDSRWQVDFNGGRVDWNHNALVSFVRGCREAGPGLSGDRKTPCSIEENGEASDSGVSVTALATSVGIPVEFLLLQLKEAGITASDEATMISLQKKKQLLEWRRCKHDQKEQQILINGRYRDNGDGTLTDLETGLQWMRWALGQTWQDGTCVGEAREYSGPEIRSFGEAFDRYATYPDHREWDLPTLYEMRTLLYGVTGAPASPHNSGAENSDNDVGAIIDPSAFPKAQVGFFWSSDVKNADLFRDGDHCYIDFSDGSAFVASERDAAFVRLVCRESLISGTYIDCGDGTVIDSSRSIQWMRCALGQTWQDGACIGEARDFYYHYQRTHTYQFRVEVESICQELGYAGHRDWRLPRGSDMALDEVYAIFHSERTPFPLPAGSVNPAVFPDIQDRFYWMLSPVRGNIRALAYLCIQAQDDSAESRDDEEFVELDDEEYSWKLDRSKWFWDGVEWVRMVANVRLVRDCKPKIAQKKQENEVDNPQSLGLDEFDDGIPF